MGLRPIRPRMTAVIAGCALVAAAGGAGASYAWLGDTHASTGNSATAGTIVLTGIDPAANNVLPPSPYKVIRPGGADASGIQTVGNGGDVPGALSVRVSEVVKLTANDLASVLRINVTECASGSGSTCGDPVNRYDASVPSAGDTVALGSLAPGATKRIRIRVYWPSSNPPNSALYNDQMGLRLSWKLRTTG